MKEKKSIVSTIVFAIALLFFALASSFVLLGGSKADTFVFGYKPFIVSTGSMEPEYLTKSVVLIQQVEYDEVQVGDVIAFKTDVLSNGIAFHRIVEVSEEGYKTKGDNNDFVDPQIITEKEFMGVEVFHSNAPAPLITRILEPGGVVKFVVLPVAGITILIFAVGILRKK